MNYAYLLIYEIYMYYTFKDHIISKSINSLDIWSKYKRNNINTEEIIITLVITTFLPYGTL